MRLQNPSSHPGSRSRSATDQIKHSLEKELDVTLFRRRSKGVEITEEGIQLFGYAEKTLKDVAMIQQIGSETGQVWLKVASNPSSNMASLFTSYFERLREEGIYLKFTECGIEEMIEKMVRERYDLGFVFAPMDRQFALKMMAEHRHLNRVISTNSDHLMVHMLEEGKVCNIGSYWLREKFKEHNFRMIPIEGYEESVSFGYLKHRNHSLRPEAAQFMEYLLSEVLDIHQ